VTAVISLIIPLYNEEENVLLYERELFPTIASISIDCGEKFEYIFIDDGSTDRTRDLLEKIMRDLPDALLITHGRNKGLGAALRTGIQNAKGELMIILDADLTFRPENIKDLLTGYRKSDADCVSGSPYLNEDHLKNVAIHRLVISKTINGIYRLLLGKNITSISPIFRLYRRSSLENISLVSDNFEINAEILAKLLISGKKVYEVPVPLYQRKFGVSKINIWKEMLNNISLIGKIIGVKYFNKNWE